MLSKADLVRSAEVPEVGVAGMGTVRLATLRAPVGVEQGFDPFAHTQALAVRVHHQQGQLLDPEVVDRSQCLQPVLVSDGRPVALELGQGPGAEAFEGSRLAGAG